MIYMVGDERKQPVTVVGGDPGTNTVHFIHPETKEYKSWDIFCLWADDGIQEISNAVKQAEKKFPELWKYWKANAESIKHEPGALIGQIDYEAIEKKHKGVPGFCIHLAAHELKKLIKEKGEIKCTL